MAILAECPLCHRKQATKNKVCFCGQDLDKAKKSKKVRYWINYTLNGKQCREAVGKFDDLDPYSIDDARALQAKRKVQKRENHAFDVAEYDKKIFLELTEWYLDLESVKELKDPSGVRIRLNNVNTVLGDKIVSSIVPIDLEGYQIKRKREGIAPGTIDLELTHVKAVASKAYENDLISAYSLKAFSSWKRLIKKSAMARKRTITIKEYLALVEAAVSHLKDFLVVAYHTGMRPGELCQLRWSHIDHKKGLIRLPKELTKEEKPKAIPINQHVKRVLTRLPRPIKDGPVLTYAGRPIKESAGLRTSLNTACRKAGIPYGKKVEGGIILHDFRRSFKTNTASAGVQKVYRDTILGHSLEGMDVHYIHPSEDDLHRAMDQFTAWFDAEIASFDESGAIE